MLFNSSGFLIFLPLVFMLYWVASKNLKIQNILLLLSSYYFYACWDFRFLFLLIFSTLLDYSTGIKMSEAKDPRKKKVWFWLSVLINLSFLGVFKYYNFFASSFSDALTHLGFKVDVWTLKVILPVGISFYTFHGLSYVIDIYNKKIKPERNFVDYAVFVCFFPLLVAGPIERATHLLPQILKKRKFDFHDSVRGIEQILWGFFKKVVIADTMAVIVNQVYKDADHYNSISLIIAALAFSFQIYCDFSGYSDIAIGTAKLFGIELMQNFNFPYLSRNIAEFWKRWHISLSSWFRDYLYIPLGGSKVSKLLSVRNVFIVFLVSGIWHGANWTFVVWGGIHAALFIPSFITGANKKFRREIISNDKPLPSVSDIIRIGITFSLVTIAWIFFRSESILSAFTFLTRLFSNAPGKEVVIKNADLLSYGVSYTVFFLISIYLLYVKRQIIICGLAQRFLICLLLLIFITFFGEFSEQTFIYYQF